MRNLLDGLKFAVLIQQLVQIPLAFQILEAAPCERLGGAICGYAEKEL